MLPWNRSQTALWFGLRGGIRRWVSSSSTIRAVNARPVHSARFLGQVQTALRSVDVELCGVLTDNGPRRRGLVADDEPDDGPAGRDVDGGQLPNHADAFKLADVEGVQTHLLTCVDGSQAEPERAALFRVGHQLGLCPVDRRQSGQTLLEGAQVVPHSTFCTQDAERCTPRAARWSSSCRAPKVDRATASARIADTSCGPHHVRLRRTPPVLGHQRRQPVLLGLVQPLVVPGPGDTGGSAGGAHADHRRVLEDSDLTGMDDLVRGHGMGFECAPS